MPKFKDNTQIQRADLNTGQAAGLQSFAGVLRQFSDTATRAAEPVILKSAQLKGFSSFEEGEKPEFKNEWFIGGKTALAYNKSLRSAYVSSIDNDNREKLAEIEIQADGDVAVFKKLAESYQAAMMGEMEDTESRMLIAPSLDNMITSGGMRVMGLQHKRAQAEAEQQRANHAKGASDSANMEAFNGQQENAAISLLGVFASIDQQMEAGDITKAEGQNRRRNAERQTAEESMRGELLRFADSDSIEEAVTKLDKMTMNPEKGFTTQEWRTFTTKLSAELSRKRSKRAAGIQKKNREAINALQDFEKATALGYDIDQEETDRVGALVADNEELNKEFHIIQDTAVAALLPASDRRAVLEAAETGQLDDVDQYAALLAADATINKLAHDDGYALGVSQGLIENIPMDANNPESFIQKQEQADGLSLHYGVEVSPLTDGEAQGLSDAIGDMTAQEKIGLAKTLQDSPAVWGQIAGKQAGTFAMAGATGDVSLMTAVFDGQELIDNKLATPIKSGDYLAAFNDAIEGVYGADDARDVMKAAVAHYASTADRTGVYNSSDFEASIEAVTGGIGKVNGFKVELPRGVSEDTFEDFIDDLQPETIEAMGGVKGITNERAVELIQNGRLRNIKSGEYIIDTNMGALFGPNGKPFVISWSDDLAIKNTAASVVSRVAKSKALHLITEQDVSRSSEPSSTLQGLDNSKRKSPQRGLN